MSVLGADIGGTSTRVAVSADGVRLAGFAAGGGANPHSSGTGAAERIAAALREATAGSAPVEAGVFGMAGAAAAGRARAVDAVAQAWDLAGMPADVRPQVVTDIQIAFAAGTAADDGLVLLSGTGALCARIRRGEVADRCDGMGWLLGDEGSGVWIGLAAVRAVAAQLDRRGPATAMTALIAGDLSADTDPRQGLIGAVTQMPPAHLGRFAPAVLQAAAGGDEVAGAILAEAAQRLLGTFDVIAGGSGGADQGAGVAGLPVVLAGSVLTSSGPVREAVLAGLGERGVATVRDAPAPLVGAIALAGRAAGIAVDRGRLTRAALG